MVPAPSVRILCGCWRRSIWTGDVELNLKGKLRRIRYKGLRINCLFTYSTKTCWFILSHGPAQHGLGRAVVNERAVVCVTDVSTLAKRTQCCWGSVLQGQVCPRNTDPGDLTESGDREYLCRKWWNFT